MNRTRQQLLVLHLRNADLGSEIVAWAVYDGTLEKDDAQMQTGSEDVPPYTSVLDAMRDGWRVFQSSPMPERSAGSGTGQLANEYWLERLVEVDEPA